MPGTQSIIQSQNQAKISHYGNDQALGTATLQLDFMTGVGVAAHRTLDLALNL
jgi:hypothetical protein